VGEWGHFPACELEGRVSHLIHTFRHSFRSATAGGAYGGLDGGGDSGVTCGVYLCCLSLSLSSRTAKTKVSTVGVVSTHLYSMVFFSRCTTSEGTARGEAVMAS
jgi:hypothetical protein